MQPPRVHDDGSKADPSRSKTIENQIATVATTHSLADMRPTRLSTQIFLRELADEFFSLDRGLPWTFWQLLRHPGATIRRYVEWRDPRLTRSLRYLVISLAVTALVLHLLGLSDDWMREFEKGFTQGTEGDAAGTAAVVAMFQRFDLLLALTFVPAVAVAVRKVYHAQTVNLAESSVVSAYALAQIALLQIPVLALLQLPALQSASIYMLFLLWPFGYVSWVCRGYFAVDGHGVVSAAKVGLLAGFLVLLGLLGFFMTAIAVAKLTG